MQKSKGNMYQWVTHTWNPIKGKCSHDCEYCYMKRFPQRPIRLDEKELSADLGKGNTIFVGSSTDMFARDVPDEWIRRVLQACKMQDNTYVFQSKDPRRFADFIGLFPEHCLFGTTIETNRENNLANAPSRHSRKDWRLNFISIEPIMDFDLEPFVDWIRFIGPKFVSIGADSRGHGLPEPSLEKIQSLIGELKKFTDVKVKTNLDRLNR